jgi:pimeloyl-ACP methyl ester carboxylesterase
MPGLAIEERYVEAGGLSVRYLVAGEGPPLLLLHGAGENALDWRWVMPDLAAAHSVYAPDLPGSPGSAIPATGYSPGFFERFVAAFLDALGVERASMIGNSLGGLAALRLALSEPARASSLVLVGSAGLGREVSPALRALALPGYGALAVAWGKTPPGPCRGHRDGPPYSSRALGAPRSCGSERNTGWAEALASWRRSWPLSGPRSASGDNANCWRSVCPPSGCRCSASGGRATASCPNARGRRRPPA